MIQFFYIEEDEERDYLPPSINSLILGYLHRQRRHLEHPYLEFSHVSPDNTEKLKVLIDISIYERKQKLLW